MRSYIPNSQELMVPHTVQSNSDIADLRYAAGNLYFSGLKTCDFYHYRAFPFLSQGCAQQSRTAEDFLALCAVSPSSGYLGYGLPAYPWVEPRLWPKCHLAVAGLSSAAHSSRGCTAVFSWP